MDLIAIFEGLVFTSRIIIEEDSFRVNEIEYSVLTYSQTSSFLLVIFFFNRIFLYIEILGKGEQENNAIFIQFIQCNQDMSKRWGKVNADRELIQGFKSKNYGGLKIHQDTEINNDYDIIMMIMSMPSSIKYPNDICYNSYITFISFKCMLI